ncbi:MAG: hypothetical protein ACRD2A_06315 [Vicinamibacterales bacterium]
MLHHCRAAREPVSVVPGTWRTPVDGRGTIATCHFSRTARRTTVDLFDTGLELIRQNPRREHPLATTTEVEARLHQWLHHRPGAEHGDCPGRPIDLDSRHG